MDLKPDEQKLVTDYRDLDPDGRRELLDYATFLIRRRRRREVGAATAPAEPENRCRIAPAKEERPEAAKEPIFTE